MPPMTKDRKPTIKKNMAAVTNSTAVMRFFLHSLNEAVHLNGSIENKRAALSTRTTATAFTNTTLISVLIG